MAAKVKFRTVCGLPMGTRVYQHVRTTNDRNGNPRRLWVVYAVERQHSPDMDIAQVIEEGYSGRPDALRALPCLPCVNVAPAEYHDYVRSAKAHGIYVERS